MGWPMAARLAAAGYRLVVQDADPARARRFADAHAAEAAVTPDSFSACAIVITMLPTSAIVEEVLCAPAGIARSLRPGALMLEMSSGNPADTVRIAAALGERGVRLADAPVSGGVKRAETGELAIMAGGDAASLDEAQPVLAAMGTTILRTGRPGRPMR
jgi:3-hydroxyisobutyrate dehydrogenase